MEQVATLGNAASAPNTAVSAVAPTASKRAAAPAPAVTKGKGATAAKRRARTALLHRWVRYAVQIGFFFLAPGLFVGAFNGVKYFFTQICTAQPIAITSFVVLLIAVLGFTVVFGRFFCGYACAFGTAGDLLYDAVEFLRSKTPIPRIEFPDVVVRVLSLGKYVVLAAICVACVRGIWADYSAYSPWVAFSGLAFGTANELTELGLVLLGAVAFGAIVRKRFFCQFLCPLGALFSLMPTLGVSSFTRRREHCAKNCGRCKQVCPVDIWPDADSGVHGECISCGCCADACPMANVNLVAVAKPAAGRTQRVETSVAGAQARKAAGASVETVDAAATSGKRSQTKSTSGEDGQVGSAPLRKTRASWLLLRGTGVGVTLAKAAALFFLCWYVGITRYVPPLEEVVDKLQIVLGLG